MNLYRQAGSLPKHLAAFLICLWVGPCVLGQWPANVSVPNDPIYRAWQNDATLRSICSVTENRLVAVGDRGTILVTSDAGRQWRLVSSSTSANLSDVHFDGNTGWAVGGWIGKHTGISYSTVLHSVDGGETWTALPSDRLPRLTGIRLSGSQVVCWGDYSTQMGCSVFVSFDNGLSWQAGMSGVGHVAAADVNLAGQPGAIDRLGRLGLAVPSSVQASGSSREGPTVVNAERQIKTLVATDSGWIAAGECGEIIESRDGHHWSNIRLSLPTDVAPLCTWNSIAHHANHWWVAGNPGTVVMHSGDRGATWQALPTGQTLPLNKLHFVDAYRGWAVGSQGTILATRDGGQTWYLQRQQPTRTSLVAFVNSSQEIPWSALAATIWDGRQTAAIVARQHAEPILRTDAIASHEEISQEAARQIGISELAVCPTSLDSAQLSNEKLAVYLMCLRPNVLLTALASTDPLAETTSPPNPMAAIQLAANKEFANKLASLYLSPWQVQKLVRVTQSGQSEFTEQAQRVLRGSGLTLWDILSTLPESDRRRNERTEMRTVWAASQSRANHSELLGGTLAQPNSRITGDVESLGNYQLVMGRVHRQRLMEQLMRSDNSPGLDAQWYRDFRFFVQSLPPRESSDSVVQLAEGLLAHKNWGRGRMVLDWISQSGDEDAARWATLQRAQLLFSRQLQDWIQSSDEHVSADLSEGKKVASVSTSSEYTPANVRTAGGLDSHFYSPFGSDSQLPVVSASDVKIDRAWTDRHRQGESPVVVAAAEVLAPGAGLHSSRLGMEEIQQQTNQDVGQGADVTVRLEQILSKHELLRFHPMVIFQLAANYRLNRNFSAAIQVLEDLIEQPQLVAWHQAAQQEISILEDRMDSLKWTTRAVYAMERPHLDGKLTDACWSATAPMELTSFSKTDDMPSTVRWAYDRDFLYVGIACPRDPRQKTPTLKTNRVYDADLRELDRVELLIDTDRDYANAVELAVAENGATMDRCANLPAFNPKWYVQVSVEPSQWCAEIAIPRDSITSSALDGESLWAISARRIRPHGLPQSWAQLRTHQRLLQANGLLLFEP